MYRIILKSLQYVGITFFSRNPCIHSPISKGLHEIETKLHLASMNHAEKSYVDSSYCEF